MQTPPFMRYLGIESVRTDSGSAVVALELADHHLNRRGVAHGGVVAALLDTALGAAVISAIPPEAWCATTSLSIQFIDGAVPGLARATGRVLRRGQRIAYASGEVRDSRDRLVASAQGTWHLWASKPGAPSPAPRGVVTLSPSGERVRVGKVVAVGRNYSDHAKEMGSRPDGPPVLFLKPSTAVVGGETVAIPTDAGEVHHEVELVAVIGAEGRAIPIERALQHVLGYAVGLDLTLRDVQSESKRRGDPWSLAKGFDGSAPVSPVVARESVGDGSGLEITLDVNGQNRQAATTSDMMSGVAELVSFASQRMTLERGDLLFTGTPAGVGPVCPGDRIDATIERVGRLTLTIEAEG